MTKEKLALFSAELMAWAVSLAVSQSSREMTI